MSLTDKLAKVIIVHPLRETWDIGLKYSLHSSVINWTGPTFNNLQINSNANLLGINCILLTSMQVSDRVQSIISVFQKKIWMPSVVCYVSNLRPYPETLQERRNRILTWQFGFLFVFLVCWNVFILRCILIKSGILLSPLISMKICLISSWPSEVLTRTFMLFRWHVRGFQGVAWKSIFTLEQTEKLFHIEDKPCAFLTCHL